MEEIKTNHCVVTFNREAFLSDYDLFKIEYGNVDFKNITGIYSKLEGLFPNSAVYAYDKKLRNTHQDEPSKHRIFLFASPKNEFTIVQLQETLKNVDVRIKQIIHFPDYTEGISLNRVLNLLLSMLPNHDDTLSYAHGKLICGTCSNLFNKGKKEGEILGLEIGFGYHNLLEAHTLTFAESDKVEQKKKKDSLVYHLVFDGERIYFSSHKKKGSKAFYKHPSIFRKDKKNRIPFLNFSDLDHFEESQANIILCVLEEFIEMFSKYLSIERTSYKKPLLLKAQDAEFKKEDKLLRDFLSSVWIDVSCHTSESGVDDKQALIIENSKKYIRKLFKCDFEGFFEKTEGKRQICIRIIGDKDQEHKLSKSKQEKKDNIRMKEKLQLINKGIPTQDVMISSEVDDTTIKNLFRQILIKENCMENDLPAYMVDRFKGCVITYGEQNSDTKLFYLVQLIIDTDGVISYKEKGNLLPENNEISVYEEDCIPCYYKIPDFSKGYDNRYIYCIEKGGVTYNIYDTKEYVFPEIEEMQKSLMELKKKQVPIRVYREFLDMVDSAKSRDICNSRLLEGQMFISVKTLYDDISKMASNEQGKVTRKMLQKYVRETYHVNKGQDFRTEKRYEQTLGACVNVHYWKQDECLWMYCAGPSSKGNYDAIHNKVYVRELKSDKSPDETFVKELISSLGDGWNKINDFSVHPSIFKFLKERLEMYKIREQVKALIK